MNSVTQENTYYLEEINQSKTRLVFVPFFISIAILEHFYFTMISQKSFYSMLIFIHEDRIKFLNEGFNLFVPKLIDPKELK